MLTLLVASALSLNSGAFYGTFSEIDGCTVLTVEADAVLISRSQAPGCAPLKTIPAKYELVVASDGSTTGGTASGVLKRVSAGANVLLLGKTARFTAQITKRATFYHLTFKGASGTFRTVTFWNGN